MKKGMKLGLGAAVLFAAGALAAQEQTPSINSPDYWKAAEPKLSSAVSMADGILSTKGRVMVVGKRFPIDLTKKYTLKLSAMSPNAEGNVFSLVFAGFNVFDKNGRQISSYNVSVMPGTLTEVAADAAKGSKVITVKDGSKFKAGFKTIMAGAKEDLSDLPNFNYLGAVKAVAQKDGVWEITLERPLTRDVKAGTKVREHSMAGFLYTAGVRNVKKDWVTMQGTITGVKNAVWKSQFWPAGAVTAQIIILADWGNKKVDTQFKDITLTVE